MQTVYLAGPMRGYPESNFPAFLEAAYHLRRRGLTVISPAEHELNDGYNPSEYDVADDTVAPTSVLWDIEQILQRADGIVLLPGWEASTGARAEVFVSVFKGIQVMLYGKDGLCIILTPNDVLRRVAEAALRTT